MPINPINIAGSLTTTTGTGTTLALGSALPGLIAIQSHPGISDGDEFSITIRDGGQTEVSRVEYDASGPSLINRTLVNSTTASLLNLSGNAQVRVTLLAEDVHLANRTFVNHKLYQNLGMSSSDGNSYILLTREETGSPRLISGTFDFMRSPHTAMGINNRFGSARVVAWWGDVNNGSDKLGSIDWMAHNGTNPGFSLRLVTLQYDSEEWLAIEFDGGFASYTVRHFWFTGVKTTPDDFSVVPEADVSSVSAVAQQHRHFKVMPQVDGVPIVERDSNSDGEWVRFADGTQVCKRTVASDFTVTGVSNREEFDYPAVFTAIPSGSISFESSGNGAQVAAYANVANMTTISQWRFTKTESGTFTTNVFLGAVGEWL